MTYGELAEKIARLHVLFEQSGIQKGDKIAICGRNSANWAVSFLAISTYEAIAVSILPEFTTESIHALVNHSEAKLLFVGNIVNETIKVENMPNLIGVILMNDFELVHVDNAQLEAAYKKWDADFNAKYPQGFSVDLISYPIDNMNKPPSLT